MKKPYLRSAIATVGIFAGTLLIEAQSGAGGAAAGGAASGSTAAGASGAAGTAASGTATAEGGEVSAAQGTAVRGAAGANPGGRATPPGTLNTVGGASALEANPNNLGGSINSGGITAPAAPGTQQGAVSAAQMNTLPQGVQSTLGAFAANGSLGSVTAIPGQPGTFRATVTQNGVPMEVTVGPGGQILSRAPITGSPGTAAAPGQVGPNGQIVGGGSTITTPFGTTPFVAGTVVPPTPVVMDDLPETIQESIRSQLAGVQAGRILQARTPSGVNYLVSYDQNGRPMTLVVGPDGRILSNGPAAVGAAATATAGNSTERATNATRDVAITLNDLPSEVENVLKQTAPYAEVRTVTREQRVGGDVYVIAVRDGDRAGELTIDDDGKVIRDTRRDLSALSTPPPARNDDRPEGIPYDSLPLAIRNAVRAYAASSDIRSITLGLDNDGRTVYDVVFYRDGRRDRMIIRKDGTLARIEEDVSPVFELASTKPAVIAIGDLPREVQDTIRRQTDNVVVDEITTKEVANQTVYSVRWDTNGTPVELLVNRDGIVIEPQGTIASEREGEPRPALLDREEGAVVKVVDGTPGTERALESTGAAAPAESGISVSTTLNSSDRPQAVVNLKDVPQQVQDTVKQLAGGGTIQAVSPKLEDNGMIYEVSYLNNGETRTVRIDPDGKVLPESTTSEP